MTLKELSQLYCINREIEMDKRRLFELEAWAASCSSRERAEAYMAEIVDLKGIIEAKLQQCIYERNRLERYIAAIDDSLARQALTYRFVKGLSWGQVAACIGGGNTADSVRMLCRRHMEGKK